MSSVKKCAVCESVSELKCSVCKLVSYCSKDHQKLHWKMHKNACRPYEIKSNKDLGRYLVATRDLEPNDIILLEYPVACGPKLHMQNQSLIPCVGCCRLISTSTNERCEGCGWPICISTCPGLKDKYKHGLECILLQLRKGFALNNIFEYYRQDALFPLRCLILQRKDEKKFQQFLEMEAHLDKRSQESEIYEIINQRVVNYLMENFLNPLQQIEKDNDASIIPDASNALLHKICGIIDVNALEINQNGAEWSALYLIGCLMEHSCIPNTYHVFDSSDDNKITVRAAFPIKKGEHISTSYTNVLWGTQVRREHLKLTKYFDCCCRRCQDPTELGSFLSALKCLGTEEIGACDGTQLPLNPLDEETEWACDKCPVKLPNNHVNALVAQIGEEVEKIQCDNLTVKDLGQILDKMSVFLHPNHFHMYTVKHSLIQLYGYQQGYLPNQLTDDTLKTKSKMCRELKYINEKIDPTNCRLRLYLSVILHELFLANFTYVGCKWNLTEDKNSLKKLIEEGKMSLELAKEVLKDEQNSSAGVKLKDLVSKSLQNLDKWLKENNNKLT